MITQPGKEITWGELPVGARQVFEDAGFEEVSPPHRPAGGHADRLGLTLTQGQGSSIYGMNALEHGASRCGGRRDHLGVVREEKRKGEWNVT
jgi:hypothetical protein